MGQSFSRNVVRRMEQSMDKVRTQLHEEALQDIANKQKRAQAKGIAYTDPNALETGFTRGQGPWLLPGEIQQEEFLRQQQDEQGGEKLELEPDLIQFLNDMGPVQKVVDVKFTSPRLLEHWKHEKKLQQEEEKREKGGKMEEQDKEGLEGRSEGGEISLSRLLPQERKFQLPNELLVGAISNTSTKATTSAIATATASSSMSSKLDRIPMSERRTVQEMPLTEHSTFTVARSTNFSTTIFKEDVGLGVTDLQLYNLLRKQQAKQQQQQQQAKQQPAKQQTLNPRQQQHSSLGIGNKPSPAQIIAAAVAASSSSSNNSANQKIHASRLTQVQDELIADFTRQHYQLPGISIQVEEDTHRQTLLKQTMTVLELPAIMKDADGYFFGVWPDRVDDLQVTSKLQSVPEYNVKLVLADVTDSKRQYDTEQEQLQAPIKFSKKTTARRVG